MVNQLVSLLRTAIRKQAAIRIVNGTALHLRIRLRNSILKCGSTEFNILYKSPLKFQNLCENYLKPDLAELWFDDGNKVNI